MEMGRKSDVIEKVAKSGKSSEEKTHIKSSEEKSHIKSAQERTHRPNTYSNVSAPQSPNLGDRSKRAQQRNRPNTLGFSAPQSPNLGDRSKRTQQGTSPNIGDTPPSRKLGARKNGTSVPKSGSRLIKKLELSKAKSPKTSSPGKTEPDPNMTTV